MFFFYLKRHDCTLLAMCHNYSHFHNILIKKTVFVLLLSLD